MITSPYVVKDAQVNRRSESGRPVTDVLHNKFLEAALSLDASIVEPYIPDDMALQNHSKFTFLISLRSLFVVIKMQCHDYPRVELGDHVCMCCNFGKPVISFKVYTGNEATPFYKFAYFIDVDATGKTQDIYECRGFMKSNK